MLTRGRGVPNLYQVGDFLSFFCINPQTICIIKDLFTLNSNTNRHEYLFTFIPRAITIPFQLAF